MEKKLTDKSKLEKEYKAITRVADSYLQEVTGQLNKLLQEGGVTRCNCFESTALKGHGGF